MNETITRNDLRRTTLIIVGTIGVATFLIILTIRNASPRLQCQSLHDRVVSGGATAEEEEKWVDLRCSSMGGIE